MQRLCVNYIFIMIRIELVAELGKLWWLVDVNTVSCCHRKMNCHDSHWLWLNAELDKTDSSVHMRDSILGILHIYILVKPIR